MRVVFSRHALNRLSERRISRDQVVLTVTEPHYTAPNKKGPMGTDYHRTFPGDRKLVVWGVRDVDRDPGIIVVKSASWM